MAKKPKPPKPPYPNAQLTDHFQIDAITQWDNFAGTVANVYAITEKRFINVNDKDIVVTYDTYALYTQANVQANYFKDVEYASTLFAKFNASASALGN